MTSEQLWEAFSNGDEDAWAELLARHWRQTLQYTMYRIKDRARARLVVRDVFRRIYRHRGHKIRAFQPWPFTLADGLSKRI